MVEATRYCSCFWARDSDYVDLSFTPALLAARVWVVTYILWIARLLVRIGASRRGRVAEDWALDRMARKTKPAEIIWDYEEPPLLKKDEPAGLIGPAE